MLNSRKIDKLLKSYYKKYPNTSFNHFTALTGGPWNGLNLNEKEIIEILEKCIRENKIFQVWEYKWKGEGPSPCDWWNGKLVFKRFKNI